MMLVYSVSFFWRGVAKDDVGLIHGLIQVFLEDLEEHLGPSEYTMNAHQLLHLKELLIQFGPLFANNSFIYESANGDCRRMIKASFAVDQQLINQYTYKFNLNLDSQRDSVNELKLFGEFRHRNLRCFTRVLRDGKAFTCTLYNEGKELLSRNFVVKLANGEFVIVKYYFEEGGSLFVRGQALKHVKNLSCTYTTIGFELDYIILAKLEERSKTFSFSDVIEKVHAVQEFEKGSATYKSNGLYFVIELNHLHHN